MIGDFLDLEIVSNPDYFVPLPTEVKKERGRTTRGVGILCCFCQRISRRKGDKSDFEDYVVFCLCGAVMYCRGLMPCCAAAPDGKILFDRSNLDEEGGD